MIISRTPFRISFFGGGTDYPVWFKHHPGAVLATSIDKYCYLTCRFLPPFFEHKSRILYSKVEAVKSNSTIEHPVVRETLRLLKIDAGVEIHHDADLPARAGMGSSSTFTVGLLNSLYALKHRMSTRQQLAEVAIEIEQKILRENVGCQDQVSSAYGGLNRIDFHPDESFTVTPVILTHDRLREFNQNLMLFFTGQTRMATEVAREQVENTEKKEKTLLRMFGMVEGGISILTTGHPIKEFGEMLHETWMLKKDLSSKITTSTIEEVYAEARAAGALGGKLLGAGGGGFILMFADPSHHAAIRQRLHKFLHVPFSLENSGSQIIFFQPDYPVE
ncbi:kinase [bacterium]|nr:kinase [bacterium]